MQHRSISLEQFGKGRLNQQPYNNALHQTGREGAAGFLHRRPVVEARPAGERECYPGRISRVVAWQPIEETTRERWARIR